MTFSNTPNNLGRFRNNLKISVSAAKPGSGLPLAHHTRKTTTRPWHLPRLTLYRSVVLAICILFLYWTIRSIFPPTYANVRRFEKALPQHNLDLIPPEGKDRRYLRFPGYRKGIGWNNFLQEV